MASVFSSEKRKSVCVQGLGFVGSTMSIVIASARSKLHKEGIYNVYGLEKENKNGMKIVTSMNKGVFPFKTSDQKLKKELKKSISFKNYHATTDTKILSEVDVVICDINLDLKGSVKNPTVNFNQIIPAIKSIGQYVKSNTLIIFESTVPPGTSDNIILPTLKKEFKKRGFNPNNINYTYSFERVMPGKDYFDSIKNFWRVYSSSNKVAKKKSNDFFRSIINTKKYPLTYIENLKACELTKILENSYRATNIALIDEWSKYAEYQGIDLYEVIKAISIRPTHSNIMKPGFGVGGYCLTKDPLFAKVSQNIFSYKSKSSFPFSELAIKVNRKMPENTFEALNSIVKNLRNKKVCIFGLTYKSDVEDMRDSPSFSLIKSLTKAKAEVFAHDPIVEKVNHKKITFLKNLPSTDKIKIIIFATQHKSYKKIDFRHWIKNNKIIVIDSNDVLSKKQREYLKKSSSTLITIGRGQVE